MSNPLVCGNCGTPNRANAKFCIGCAGRLPGLAPAGGVHAQIAPMQDFERERPMAASRPEPAPTSFWLHLGLVGLTMVFAFVAWCVYVLHGRTAPWSQRAESTASQAAAVREPIEAPVPVPSPTPPPTTTPTPSPAAAAPAAAAPPRTAAAEPPTRAAGAPPALDAVTQALALAKRQAAAAAQAATPAPAPQRQTDAAERTASAARSAPPRTASAPRARRDTRDLADPLDSPVVVRRPGSQPDPGPPIAAGPGPQYSWTRPAAPRAAEDPGPPIAAGPGPRYETRPEVRAPVTAVMPSGDAGPPIAIGPGPRYDYSTPPARER
ncbi:hypothetical protein WKW77_15235 [Variovorax ureilyticus]|uniref:Zinc-ribbon domain-containing protein n=1 Tax=Variovorax ureilyticus TaxID=1836198 RepID=A0ABU8VFK5_9BURK